MSRDGSERRNAVKDSYMESVLSQSRIFKVDTVPPGKEIASHLPIITMSFTSGAHPRVS